MSAGPVGAGPRARGPGGWRRTGGARRRGRVSLRTAGFTPGLPASSLGPCLPPRPEGPLAAPAPLRAVSPLWAGPSPRFPQRRVLPLLRAETALLPSPPGSAAGPGGLSPPSGPAVLPKPRVPPQGGAAGGDPPVRFPGTAPRGLSSTAGSRCPGLCVRAREGKRQRFRRFWGKADTRLFWCLPVLLWKHLVPLGHLDVSGICCGSCCRKETPNTAVLRAEGSVRDPPPLSLD